MQLAEEHNILVRDMAHKSASERLLPPAGERDKPSNFSKVVLSEMGGRVCLAPNQTWGRYHYVEDFQLERIYRDVRVCQIYEGTSGVQRMVNNPEIQGE